MLKSDGFYDYAWNPVEGCVNNFDCYDYCYARSDLKRQGKSFIPTFYEERLEEPFRKRPSRIFVTHYTDLLNASIPRQWVESILDVCKLLPEHTFIFISKNPLNYPEFVFPDNCILGVTVESPDKWFRAKAMEAVKGRKLASVEPILGNFTGYDFSQFEQVVIGAMIGRSQCKSEWVNSVIHKNIYYKTTVRQYLK